LAEPDEQLIERCKVGRAAAAHAFKRGEDAGCSITRRASVAFGVAARRKILENPTSGPPAPKSRTGPDRESSLLPRMSSQPSNAIIG
jgi:hypothetical protein